MMEHVIHGVGTVFMADSTLLSFTFNKMLSERSGGIGAPSMFHPQALILSKPQHL